MESDDRHSTACLQAFKSVGKRFFKRVKLSVHFYADSLKAFSARVLFTAVCRGNAPFYYIGKLSRSFYRRYRPCVHNALCYLRREFLLAVLVKYAPKRLKAVIVDNFARGKTLAAHSHIERRVVVERKSALRVIKLVRRNSQIRDYSVKLFYPQLVQYRAQIFKVASHECYGIALQPLPGGFNSLPVPVKANQPSPRKALCQLQTVTAAARGQIRVNALWV